MRKKYVLLVCISLLLVNLTFSNKGKGQSNALFVRNVEVLQVSAGEAECKPTSINKCSFTVAGILLVGTGQPYIEY